MDRLQRNLGGVERGVIPGIADLGQVGDKDERGVTVAG